MVRLHTRDRKSTKISVYVWLGTMTGFFVGMMFAFFLQQTSKQHESALLTSSLSTTKQRVLMNKSEFIMRQPSKLQVPQERQDSSSSLSFPGWHEIHVYYGDESGLQIAPDQEWFAQVNQDKTLIDLVGKSGYFVDLAANDAKEWSNTIALERHGWEGLCIEPNPVYWYGLSHRKCQVAGALVGATKEKVNVKFRGVYGGIVGRINEKMADFKREPDAAVEQRFTAPLLDVFRKFQVPTTIDYLSLDVEGAEYMIMKDFPFEQYQVKIMTVERPKKDLRRLLEANGFLHLKDFAWWGETLWAHNSTEFTPEHPKITKIKTEERN